MGTTDSKSFRPNLLVIFLIATFIGLAASGSLLYAAIVIH
jgi:hypothetical protein